jgi:two-component system NtrC family sensor kinase
VDAPGEIGALAQRFEQMAERIGERERLQTALARGDRLAAVGTMAAGVAHEINNPLTTVLGYAKLLLEDKPDEHIDRAGLELIAEEAARMKGIVRNLLDYSRSEQPRKSSAAADVNELLRKTAAMLAPSIRRQRVELTLELADELPNAAADLHALHQVFVNLVYNAAQAMPDGGMVTARSSLAPGGVALHVDIVDEGPGISADVRERIFEPFYTTKDAGKGTGLGLAVCKHLVSRFNGAIEVADGPDGRGARFRVVIPVSGR